MGQIGSGGPESHLASQQIQESIGLYAANSNLERDELAIAPEWASRRIQLVRNR